MTRRRDPETKAPSLRTLRREDAGFTTIQLKAVSDKRLCSMCDRIYTGCPVLRNLQSSKLWLLDSAKFEVVVTKCDRFIPRMEFASQIGLNSDIFNTFRLGKAWSERVKPGDTICASNLEGERIGYFEVTEAVSAPKEKAIAWYSFMNHLLVERKLTSRKAASEMRKILPSVYGPLLVNHAKQISVITLRKANQCQPK